MLKTLGYVILFSFIFCLTGYSQKRPEAQNGLIDLTAWDFEKNGNTFLDGEWNFYWKTFVDPHNFLADTIIAPNKIIIPGRWSGMEIGDSVIDGAGYATFHLRIKLPPKLKTFSLRISEVMSASKIWVNDSCIYSIGVIGKDSESSIPQKQIVYTHLNTDTSIVNLVFHVSNYHHQSGGIYKHIRIGLRENIEKFIINTYALDIIMFGSMLIAAIYFLIQFFIRRRERFTIYFAVCLIIIAIRAITSGGDAFVFYAMNSIPYHFSYKLDHITFYLEVVFFAFYLRSLFPDEFTFKRISLFVFAGITYSIVSIFSNIYFAGKILLSFQIIAIGAASCFIWWLILANRNKRKGALMFLIGIFMLTIFMVNDILVINQVINTYIMFPIAMFLFIFVQMIILGRRFTTTIKTNELLTVEYTTINRKLESDVAEKTFEIESRSKELQEQTDILKMVYHEIENINKDISEQKNQIEQYNSDIYASLRYAKLVQSALFTPSNEINKLFPEHFVFYQPKDIVGGDFYWMKKLYPAGEELWVIAIGDCTGHGIPAAFLTTYGISFLNEVFSSTSMICDFDTTAILRELQTRLSLLVKPDHPYIHGDGIDMLLCIYLPGSGTLQFSGTNNFLYHAKNNNSDISPVKEYKLLGHMLSMDFGANSLAQTTISLSPGDSIYLLTDGLSNQLGGLQEKRLSTNNVRVLLNDINKLPISEQKIKIEKCLEMWMNNDEQTDDILVLGFKIPDKNDEGK